MTCIQGYLVGFQLVGMFFLERILGIVILQGHLTVLSGIDASVQVLIFFIDRTKGIQLCLCLVTAHGGYRAEVSTTGKPFHLLYVMLNLMDEGVLHLLTGTGIHISQ